LKRLGRREREREKEGREEEINWVSMKKKAKVGCTIDCRRKKKKRKENVSLVLGG